MMVILSFFSSFYYYYYYLLTFRLFFNLWLPVLPSPNLHTARSIGWHMLKSFYLLLLYVVPSSSLFDLIIIVDSLSSPFSCHSMDFYIPFSSRFLDLLRELELMKPRVSIHL